MNIPTANDNYLRMVGMSADGSVIVGNRADPGGLVFRWTQATGAVAVGVTGGDWAEAFGVSPDGATIVGANYWSEWDIGHIAFKHTQTGTVNPSPVRTSNARRTSADGTYVVGDSHLSWGVDHAYRWDAAGGFIDLGTLGSNSRDSHATNVSADGSVVVGYARHPTLNDQLGVIWTIRDLGTDFNGDGFVDFFDYNRFVECFEGLACPAGRDADHNRDGFVDFFDYESYVTAFEEGC